MSKAYANPRSGGQMAGYVVSGMSKERLNDVLTWHDHDGNRIWIHSKAIESGREILSIEVQVVGERALKPSKEEESLRLKLCARRQLPIEPESVNSKTFRTLPSGQFLDEHSEIVSRIFNERSSNREINTIKLLEQVASKTVDLGRLYRWDSSDEIAREGKKSKDAILIAKVYEMLQSSGTRKLSSRTAELLGLDVSVVHTAVQVARRNGWLTSNGAGLSGGVLTEEGEKLFRLANGPARVANIMNSGGKK
jgi:hypothetical protein